MAKKILKAIVVYILIIEARIVLKKYKPRIIAVTGNVGKTSAKDAIYTILSRAYYVRKSEKSFNSEIGIPLTILGGRNGWHNIFVWLSDIMEGLRLIFLKNHYPKWLVLEVGADRPGLMKEIARWLAPDIVIVTTIGELPVHVEIFKTPERLLQEKAELVKALKRDGLLVVQMDDPRAMALKEKFSGRTATFGSAQQAGIFASHAKILYDKNNKPRGITFKVNHGSTSVPVRLDGVLGFHHANAVLAAFSVAVSQDINLVSAVEWLAGYHMPPGRLRIIEGAEQSTVLDDSYNASPEAMKAALLALAAVETEGRKIAVLGDMLELGKYSVEAHKEIGARAAQVCDRIIAVGPRAQEIAQEAHRRGMAKKHIHNFNTAREAGAYARGILSRGDIILVKGSQGMRMERAVEELMAHPEDRHKLLVRQDSEWLAR